MLPREKPTVSFILSLIAGATIISGGFMTSMVGVWLRSAGFNSANGFVTWPGAPGSGVGMFELGFALMGAMGLIAGIVVIFGATMLIRRPKKHATWGSLIILFSFFSIYGSAMGGLGIGLVLGLVGGVLAITWKPKDQLIK